MEYIDLTETKEGQTVSDSEILLDVRSITKVFLNGKSEKTVAADKVSFQIYRGETLGLVGGSGCGKSTLAKMITGLMEPDEGSIRFEEKEISGLHGKSLGAFYRDVQMVFQSPAGSFDPRKTIGDSIGESLKNAGISKSARKNRVAKLLEKCGLAPETSEKFPHEISGGQCQRAAIARALAINPKLVICDEATSSLDMTVQKEIMELFGMLKAETGLSYLFICHNLALAQSFCDRILVMHDGKIVETGTPDQIISSPESDYTKELVEAAASF